MKCAGSNPIQASSVFYPTMHLRRFFLTRVKDPADFDGLYEHAQHRVAAGGTTWGVGGGQRGQH